MLLAYTPVALSPAVEIIPEGATVTLTGSPPNNWRKRPSEKLAARTPEEPLPKVETLPDRVTPIGPAVDTEIALAD
jgi:hypothetical protein